VLGATADMVPVSVRLRSFNEDNSIRTEKELHFNVFVQQKWTPFLMMATLANSISEFNDYREECTYRVERSVVLDGQKKMLVSTMQAPGELSIPGARAAGRLVGRQVQPAVHEHGDRSAPEARGRHCRSAARPPASPPSRAPSFP